MSTEANLLPCPFCGSPVKHIESIARSFNPNRVYHEWHHEFDNDCLLRKKGKVLEYATDDEAMQARFCAAWNRRALSQSSTEAKELAGRLLEMADGKRHPLCDGYETIREAAALLSQPSAGEDKEQGKSDV